MMDKEKETIRSFGHRVYLPNVVEHFKAQGTTWAKARAKVLQMVLEEKKSPDFIGFERTSEIFISRHKDDSWRDKQAKRNWIMYQDSFISHMNFKKNETEGRIKRSV